TEARRGPQGFRDLAAPEGLACGQAPPRASGEAENIEMSYVYIQSEPGLFTVGFYDPSGRWHAESDHGSRGKAADRVARLNGGAALDNARNAMLIVDDLLAQAGYAE